MIAMMIAMMTAFRTVMRARCDDDHDDHDDNWDDRFDDDDDHRYDDDSFDNSRSQVIVTNLSSKLGPMLYVFPLQNVQGALEHLRTLVTEAELFYLRHVRTCAASTFGHRCTCSGGTSCRCISGLPLIRLLIMSLVKVVLTFVMSMFVK